MKILIHQGTTFYIWDIFLIKSFKKALFASILQRVKEYKLVLNKWGNLMK